MRGEVLRYDDQAGEGLISGDDGGRYGFSRIDLQQLAPLPLGQRVDFAATGDRATQIFVIGTPPASANVAPATSVAGPPPPGPQRNVWQHFIYCLTHYVDGNGRANRAEYWSYTLFIGLFIFVALIIDTFISTAVNAGKTDTYVFLPIFTVILLLGTFLPGICVTIRRLHDVGMSGWLILIGGIPYVGGLFTFVISVLPGQNGPNAYGPGPGFSH